MDKRRFVLGLIITILVFVLLCCGATGAFFLMFQNKAETKVVETFKEVPSAEIADEYQCKLVEIGTPVDHDGECTFCTINYSKPGQVFIAGKQPLEYTQGAYVFQYNSTDNLSEFRECIAAQPFVTDQSLGYTPIWP